MELRGKSIRNLQKRLAHHKMTLNLAISIAQMSVRVAAL